MTEKLRKAIPPLTKMLDIILWVCIVWMAIAAIATIHTKGRSYALPMWNTFVLGWCICSKSYSRLLNAHDKITKSWESSANSWRNIAERRDVIASKWKDMAIKLAPEHIQDELHDLEVSTEEKRKSMN